MSDFSKIAIIFIVYIALFVFIFYSIGLEAFKKNFSKYRCNPIVMPFVGIFGYNIMDNFSTCVSQIQSEYTEILLAPVNLTISKTLSTIDSLNDTLTNTQTMLSNVRGSDGLTSGLLGSITSIEAIMVTIIIEALKIVLILGDTVKKIFGIIAGGASIFYGIYLTIISAWCGDVGKGFRILTDTCPKSNIVICSGGSVCHN
tara:strand:- start:38 stop:640 length:603 start_codon:yes stop_codon:yes gene_type:complete